ncbi:hypothetical protein [Portibacter lacus]|uniref:Uncharacterized protein n=1 Tax=Portibacter lacus TaxID=1099794 RepID=A0AA37SUG9_9BACT|nr:hypothetical protein [Portibacter lacus]GLR18996.1 hypothetical protein GCM10007940_36120 [Portibacter lacus]
MMQTYTEQDLIRFIYKEVEICEYFEIDYAVQNDTQLKEEYQSIKESVDALPKVSFNPSANSLNSILSYAAMV